MANAVGNPAAALPARPGAQPAAAPAAGAAPAAPGITAGDLVMPAVQFKVGSLSDAITSITGFVGARQKYLSKVSAAITQEASKPGGSLNQAALSQLNIEVSTAALLSEQAKKLQDSLEQSVRAWVR